MAGTRNRLFVLPKQQEERKSKGGIILIEDEEKKPTEGVVIAVSQADENGIKPNLAVGDNVFFSEFAGQPAEFEDIKYLVMKESDIFAKLKVKPKTNG